MKMIFLIIVALFSACGSSDSNQSNPILDSETIDERYINSLHPGDTIVFTNSEFGSDTLIIDSIFKDKITNLGINNHTGLYATSRYLCGSSIRLSQNEITQALGLQEFTNPRIYYSQKFKSSPQSHMFFMAEFMAFSPQVDTLCKFPEIPNFTCDVVINSDTTYMEPSEFHIKQLLWSFKHGPVGFVTIGNHIWLRE